MYFKPHILEKVAKYYGDKISRFGPTALGVDWNKPEYQEARFAQFLRLLPRDRRFSLLDYGCGYSAFYEYLKARGFRMEYIGCDISEGQIAAAQSKFGDHTDFHVQVSSLPTKSREFAIASGVMNVKLDIDAKVWTEYVLQCIGLLDSVSTEGFAFNMKSSLSDPEYRKEFIHYADPSSMFEHCARYYSRNLSLLHDYDLYDFTILVFKTPG